MSDVIHSAVIEVGVDSSGVDVGIAQIDSSFSKLGKAAGVAGKEASAGINEIGAGGAQAAAKVEQASTKIVRSVANIGKMAEASGNAASSGIGKIGDGGNAASIKMDSATRNIALSIQRAGAVMTSGAKGSAEYYQALANSRGANVATLQPFIDQLAEITSKTRMAAEAQRGLEESTKFLQGLKGPGGRHRQDSRAAGANPRRRAGRGRRCGADDLEIARS